MNFFSKEFLDVFKDEVNVKEVMEMTPQDVIPIKQRGIETRDGERWVTYRNEDGSEFVSLNIEVTRELKEEGLKREIIRAINQERKKKGLTIQDQAIVEYNIDDALLSGVLTKFNQDIMQSTLTAEFVEGADGDEVVIDGRVVRLKVGKK